MLDVVTRDLPVAGSREPFDAALARLNQTKAPALFILHESGRLVGLLMPESVGEMMLVRSVRPVTEQLRRGLVAKAPAIRLEGEVEVDEVYVVAGHKGQPAAVAKRGGLDAAAGWLVRRAEARGRRTSRLSLA